VLHRQDFEISDIITDYLHDSLNNVVNENEINDPSRLVDKILSQNIRIAGFQKIADVYDKDWIDKYFISFKKINLKTINKNSFFNLSNTWYYLFGFGSLE